jgi:predicted DNA binding CopG/RHH family protein
VKKVLITLADADHAAIKRKAEKAGLTLQNYCEKALKEAK